MGWLTGWGCRKSFVINPVADAGTDYQKKITAHYGSGEDDDENVYLNSQCRTDFGDVRFAYDETVLLGLDGKGWIESKTDSDSALMWIKVDEDLSSEAKTIYIYYGKADETYPFGDDQDEMDANFPFADHFYGSSIDATKWDLINSPTVSVGSSTVSISGSSDAWRSILGKTAFGPYGYAVRIRGALPANAYILFGMLNTVADDMLGFFWLPGPQRYKAMAYNEGASTLVDVSGSTATRIYETCWLEDLCKYFINNASACADISTNVPNEACKATGTVYTAGYIETMDWIVVRKYVYPEPTGTWGEEESFYHIAGVTRDANGNPLGGCTVCLFKSSDKTFTKETTSDVNGAYSFNCSDDTTQFFVRSYKDGVPNVFGTTDDDLVGS